MKGDGQGAGRHAPRRGRQGPGRNAPRGDGQDADRGPAGRTGRTLCPPRNPPKSGTRNAGPTNRALNADPEPGPTPRSRKPGPKPGTARIPNAGGAEANAPAPPPSAGPARPYAPGPRPAPATPPLPRTIGPRRPHRREPRLIALDLRGERRQRVDPQRLAELQQIRQYVRDLVLDPAGLPRVRHHLRRLLRRQPLEDLDEFGRLDAQRGGQVLGRVVLLPVPRGRELGQASLQRMKILTHASRCSTCTPGSPSATEGSRTVPSSRTCPRSVIRTASDTSSRACLRSIQRSIPSAITVIC